MGDTKRSERSEQMAKSSGSESGNWRKPSTVPTNPPLAEGNGELGDLDSALENHEYPMTTDDVITAYGDRKVETQDGWESVKAGFTSIDDELYDFPDDVRNRILGLIHRG
ncbi:DUF5789 family protein [Natronococcus wangiae]|uniref:DUF5789 family protein n=1 Tax=Natronococcus wangiae TaxID=3068275 RepID=UPI00273F8598|nr:hypothetical protein [Natronococcus sp. AD5]